MKLLLLVVAFTIVITCSLTSCDKEKDNDKQEQTFKGPEVSMGNGKTNAFF